MLKLATLQGAPEVFYSIQGEGRHAGRPSVFIRLSLCNLWCRWCDTDYTWNWVGTPFAHQHDGRPGYQKFEKASHQVMLPAEEVARLAMTHPCRRFVITGGEPLVQKKDLLPLLQLLKQDASTHIEIETNGTLVPQPELDAFVDQYNVSVKLSNSGVPAADRLVPDAIRFFADSPRACFKFVVDSPGDVEEVKSIAAEWALKPEQIILMPQGVSAPVLNEKSQWLVEVCKALGFAFSGRLHVILWGDKKGV